MPERFPVVEGANVALTVQLDPAARLEPQVFEAMKLPFEVMLEIANAFVLVFVSVTLSAPLFVPTTTFPNVKLLGASETVG